MLRVEIPEQVADESALVDLLNHIATLVKQGYKWGVDPRWSIETVEEESIKG